MLPCSLHQNVEPALRMQHKLKLIRPGNVLFFNFSEPVLTGPDWHLLYASIGVSSYLSYCYLPISFR